MTTNSSEGTWRARLATATRTARVAVGPAALAIAGEALRLAWATGGTVRGADADAELWWLRAGEVIADTGDELDLLHAAPHVKLGTGPTPVAELTDSPELRAALADLLAAVRDALRRYAGQSVSGRERLIATFAVVAAALAVTAASL